MQPPRGLAPALPGLTCLASLDFGALGNAGAATGAGWSFPERDFTWSLGRESELRMPLPAWADGAEFWLELRLSPFVAPGHESQRLHVRANSVLCGDETISGAGTLAFLLSDRVWAARTDGVLQFRLQHPDFARPCDVGASSDDRQLAFMVFALRVLRRARPPATAITVLPPRSLPPTLQDLEAAILQQTGCKADLLISGFESLGHNCEFGLVQRRLNAEPLGLLRFAGLGLDNLLSGLRAEFAGLENSLRVETPDSGSGDYMVADSQFGMVFHSFTRPSDETADTVRSRFERHLRRLRQHFIEQLRLGGRIYVFHQKHEIRPAEARALALTLQSFGNNAVLVVDGHASLPSGAVAQLGYGLFQGRLDRFAPIEDAGNLDLPGWVSLCLNAHLLRRAAMAR